MISISNNISIISVLFLLQKPNTAVKHENQVR